MSLEAGAKGPAARTPFRFDFAQPSVQAGGRPRERPQEVPLTARRRRLGWRRRRQKDCGREGAAARIGMVAAVSRVGPPSWGADEGRSIARPVLSVAPAWLRVFLVVVRTEQNQAARAPDHQRDECEAEEQIEPRLL